MKLLHLLPLLPFALAHPNHPSPEALKPPYEIGTVQFPLIDPRPDPFSPEPRSRILMITITYPLLTPPGKQYSFSAYFPPVTARLTEASYGLPENFLSNLTTQGYEAAPFISNETPKIPKLRVLASIPGFGGLRHLSQNITGHLTQQYGYITIATESPYEADIVEYPDGRIALTQFSNFDGNNATIDRLIDARVKDWGFIFKNLSTDKILGQIPGCKGKKQLKACARLVETRKVGVFGHSLGGHTVGALATLKETRGYLSGVVGMDGIYNSIVTAETSKGLQVPFLNMAREDRGSSPDWEIAKEKARKNRPRVPNGEMWVNGTGHNSFTDLPALIEQLGLEPVFPREKLVQNVGDGDLKRQSVVIRAYLGAFFEWVFGRETRGKKQPLGLLSGNTEAFPEVVWRDRNWAW